ncbi:MAG: sll0787 family AIR synthase-like protein [Bacteroidota bacterium]
MIGGQLQAIMDQVLSSQSVIDKINIAATHVHIGGSNSYTDPITGDTHRVAIGDDCAAIPDGQGGYLLFAAEGMISSFTESSPWFAGYSAVMVNISDVCAMGGLPMALTDVLWVKADAQAMEIWAGMQAASKAYGVPIVGGHTCYGADQKQLAVSILGRAGKLLSGFDARPGESLMMAVDLNGQYYENYPFWNASTTATPVHLQKLSRLMYQLAEQNLSRAAKDISMGGIIGTLAMLMQTSQVGTSVQLEHIPKPANVPWEKWLVSFPSFGYLFTCKKQDEHKVQTLFSSAQVSCAKIGEISDGSSMLINYRNEQMNINLK